MHPADTKWGPQRHQHRPTPPPAAACLELPPRTATVGCGRPGTWRPAARHPPPRRRTTRRRRGRSGGSCGRNADRRATTTTHGHRGGDGVGCGCRGRVKQSALRRSWRAGCPYSPTQNCLEIPPPSPPLRMGVDQHKQTLEFPTSLGGAPPSPRGIYGVAQRPGICLRTLWVYWTVGLDYSTTQGEIGCWLAGWPNPLSPGGGTLPAQATLWWHGTGV